MTYLVSQIVLSLLLAAIGGAAIGWIIHGHKAHQRERGLRTALERQAAATAHAQQERQMIADDFDDMKLGLESKLTEIQFENRQIPKLQENLEKSQQIVQQMIKKHDSEINELASHNNDLHGQIERLKLRIQEVTHAENKTDDTTKSSTGTKISKNEPSTEERSSKEQQKPLKSTNPIEQSNNVTDVLAQNEPDTAKVTGAWGSKTKESDTMSKPSSSNASETQASTQTRDSDLSPDSSFNHYHENLTTETQVQNELFALEHEIDDMRHGENELFGALEDDNIAAPLDIVDESQKPSPLLAKSGVTDSGNNTSKDQNGSFDKFAAKHAHNEISPDDLKNIHGIGPVIEQSLNDMGINNYRQIASLTRKEIEEIADILKIFPGRIERDNWVGSAKKLLDDGNPSENKHAALETENA